MFPAITEALRDLKDGFGSDPIQLGLKSQASLVSFDTVSAEWYARNGYRGISEALGGSGPSWSGEVVSVDAALNLSVVWACTRIISESLGFLPASLMQKRDGAKRVAEDHPVHALVHDEPNPNQSDMEFRETDTAHCVLRGNAYAQILRRSGTGTAVELIPLLPTQVRSEFDSRKRIVYFVKDSNGPEKSFTVIPGQPHDILHIRGMGYDGVQGYSVVTMARQSMGLAMAADKHAGKFHAYGGRVPYVLKAPRSFPNDEERKRFREEWNKTYSEPHKAVVLEGQGWEYQQIGITPEDAQLLATRQFSVIDICRWFRVSPHLVGDLSRATFSNIEQLALEFVQMTLMAWIVRWEKALRRCVLTPQEKADGYYFKFNAAGLLRGDFASRMTGYATALQNGHLSINEVRDLEDRNPIEGGDQHFVQLNMRDVNGPAPTQAVRVPVRPGGQNANQAG